MLIVRRKLIIERIHFWH